jgi:hypothetical protein
MAMRIMRRTKIWRASAGLSFGTREIAALSETYTDVILGCRRMSLS